MPKRRRTEAERTAAKAKRQAAAEAKRQKATERRVSLEREAAIRAEELAEEQAPAAQRRSRATVATALALDRRPRHPGPATAAEVDGAMTEAMRAGAVRDVKRGGYRRADPLERMASVLTEAHRRAARRFSGDYETGMVGATGTRDGVGGFTPGGPTDARLDAVMRYRAACDAMGPSLRTPVQLAVLHKWTLTKIGELLRIDDSARVSGYLVAGLDRLADHYWPEREGCAPMLAVAALVDAGVTDIPQERLGRGRVAA